MNDEIFLTSMDDWFDFEIEQNEEEINTNLEESFDGLDCLNSVNIDTQDENNTEFVVEQNNENYMTSKVTDAVGENFDKLIDAINDEVVDNAISEFVDNYVGNLPVSETQDINESKKVDNTSTTLSPSTLEKSLDLTEWVDSWLEESLKISDLCGCQEISAELRTLDSIWRSPSFRLAFVGEFSRGKSSLINRLLNRDILSVGELPTTATLTTIVAGNQDLMRVRIAKNKWQSRPLEEQSWSDLTITDHNGDEQTAIAQVSLTVTDPWLQDLGIELVDTPGIGDLNDRRAALAIDLLTQCDAAVLVVSATLPFSMTEAAFLKQEIVGRHVPRILVAVSKLDTIPIDERQDVFDAIRQRITKISSEITVLPLHPLQENISETEAFNQVKTYVESMVAKGERQIWRSRKIAGQITNYLSHLIKACEIAISTAHMETAEKEVVLREQKEKMLSTKLEWERISLDLEQRRLQHTQTLQEKVLQEKADLESRFAYELKKAPNPKIWWEEDLPFRLRRQLLTLSEKLEDYVLKTLNQDFEWLQGEVSNLFSINITRRNISNTKAVTVDLNLQQIALNDIQQYWRLTRLGGSAATILSSVLTAPVAIAVSTTLWIVSEQVIKEKLDEQRRLLSQELQLSFNQVFDEYFKLLTVRLRQFYNQLIEDMKRQEAVWQSTYDNTINMNSNQNEKSFWLSVIDKSNELQTKIIRKLSESL